MTIILPIASLNEAIEVVARLHDLNRTRETVPGDEIFMLPAWIELGAENESQPSIFAIAVVCHETYTQLDEWFGAGRWIDYGTNAHRVIAKAHFDPRFIRWSTEGQPSWCIDPVRPGD